MLVSPEPEIPVSVIAPLELKRREVLQDAGVHRGAVVNEIPPHVFIKIVRVEDPFFPVLQGMVHHQEVGVAYQLAVTLAAVASM